MSKLPPFTNRSAWMRDYGWVPPLVDGFEPKTTILENGWGVAVIELTPDLGIAFLSAMVDNQRPLPGGTHAQLVGDIQGGRWRTTHQGIAFNKAGKMFDGQTRCQAVVTSGLSVPILAFFGVGANDEMLVTDTGKVRSRIDAAHVVGMTKVNRNMSATIVQALTFGTPTGSYDSRRKLTNAESVIMFEKYADQAALVDSWFSKARRLNVGAVRAAMLAALVSGEVGEGTLCRFAGVYTDSLSGTEPGDSAPRLLRQFIVNNPGGRAAGQSNAHDLFLRSCAAIVHASAQNPIQVLRPAKTCPWPMPEHRGARR